MDISRAHQLFGYATVVVTLDLLVVASWSVVAARASSGALDHRFAVDRSILGLVALLALDGLVGLGLLLTGARPAAALHLLYGPAAFVTVPVGYWLARRGGIRVGPGPGHGRRDVWVAVAAVVLLGIEYRLLVTG
jgi:hypothetical protein